MSSSAGSASSSSSSSSSSSYGDGGDMAAPSPARVTTPMQSTETRGATLTTPKQTGQVRAAAAVPRPGPAANRTLTRRADRNEVAPVEAQIAVIMVGLPARGKTHTAQKLSRYLRWLGFNSQIFDVGHYRRDTYGVQPSAAFFDHGASRARAHGGPQRRSWSPATRLAFL